MPPLELLCFVVAITAGSAAAGSIRAERRRRKLKALAARWEMHFAPDDPFRLGRRVASRLAMPGAANIRLRDVIYGIEGDYYRYYFTVEYTLHAVSARTRVRHAATFLEPRSTCEEGAALTPKLIESDGSIPELIDQYLSLKPKPVAAVETALPDTPKIAG